MTDFEVCEQQKMKIFVIFFIFLCGDFVYCIGKFGVKYPSIYNCDHKSWIKCCKYLYLLKNIIIYKRVKIWIIK